MNSTLPFPNDTSHTTAAAASLFRSYFEAKSDHDPDRTMRFYSRARTSHNDATLGWTYASWDALADLFSEYMPTWGDGRSYATGILGDEQSAVVFVYDSPELFGGELRTISAVDFDGDGKITRFVDYWDGRNFGSVSAAALRSPVDAFPQRFGEDQLPQGAARPIADLAAKLNQTFVDGAPEQATSLFAPDAVLEDLTLRTSVHGRQAIGAYIDRGHDRLPYGRGTSIRRVLGSELGGGYEWVNETHAAKRGIVALALTPDGLIDRLTAVWDGDLMEAQALGSLALMALEPA